MKQLNMEAIMNVDSNVAIDKYQGEHLRLLHQNITLSAQCEKQLALIETLFSIAPEVFPDNFVIETKENNKNDTNKK